MKSKSFDCFRAALGLCASTTLAANRYLDANGTAVNRGGNGAWKDQFWSASSDGTSSPYGTLLDVQQLYFARILRPSAFRNLP